MSTSDFLSTSGTNSYLTPTIDMQNLPAWYQNAEQQILGQASTIAGASQPIYQGPQLADFTDPQNQAFAGVNSLQGSTNAPLQGAIGSSGQIAQGYDASQAQQYQNPYTQNVVQDINTLGQQTLNQQLLPGTAGDFIKAGAFGGQQYGNTQAEVIQKQDQNIAQQQNAALQSSQAASQANYLQGQQNQNTANTNVGNLTNQYDTQNLNNLNAQLNVGNQQQQQQQNAYGVAQNNFYNQANYPLEQLGIAQAALRGTTIPTEGQIFTPSNSSTSSASSLQALLQGLQGTGTSAATGGMIPYMAAGGQVKGYATGNAVSNEQPTTEMGSASAAFSPNEYYRARLMLNQLKQLGQPTIPNQQPSAEDPGAVVKNLIQNPIYAPTGGVAPIQQPLAQHVPQAQMLAQQSAGTNNPSANPGLINPQLSTQQMLQQLAQSIGQSNLKGQAFKKGGMLKGYAEGDMVEKSGLSNADALKVLASLSGPSVAQNQIASAQTAQEAPPPMMQPQAATPAPAQQASTPSMGMMGMTPEMMADRQKLAMQNIQQLADLGQGAVPAQQAAEAARQQYANTDQSTAQAQLAATLQAKPWLAQPYQGGANPELAIQAADAIKDQNPGLAASLKLLGGPSVDELNQRNAYQEQLRALTLGPAGTQEKVAEANYGDKEKALQEAATTATSGLGTSAMFNSPIGMLSQKALIDQQIATEKAAGRNTDSLQAMSDALGGGVLGKTSTPAQKAQADAAVKQLNDPKDPFNVQQDYYRNVLAQHDENSDLIQKIPDAQFNTARNNPALNAFFNAATTPKDAEGNIKAYQSNIASLQKPIAGVQIRNMPEFTWKINQLNDLGQSKDSAAAREDYNARDALLHQNLNDQAAELVQQSANTRNPITLTQAQDKVQQAFTAANPSASLFKDRSNPTANPAALTQTNIVAPEDVQKMIDNTKGVLSGATPTTKSTVQGPANGWSAKIITPAATGAQ